MRGHSNEVLGLSFITGRRTLIGQELNYGKCTSTSRPHPYMNDASSRERVGGSDE